MKIYTKTGDKGETSLFSGTRIQKNHPTMDAIGNIDECNSAIGIAISLLPKTYNRIEEQLQIIQHALFDVGAHIATPITSSTEKKLARTRFDEHSTEAIEKWIDAMELELPKLQNFILPGGHPSGAMLHLARSICRRAERSLVLLSQNGDIGDHCVKFINRLSDYLFVLSRYVNFLSHTPETAWQPHRLGE